MRISRNSGISITLIVVVLFVLVNVWASNEANKVTPLETAAVATAGIVNSDAHQRSQHLNSAQDGFYLLRAWHWMRYSMMTKD